MRQEEEDDRTWRAARWQAGRKAIADGTFETHERRFPVLITPDGPVSSPEKLQRLAEMESIPEALEATLIRENGNSTEKRVEICCVNYDGREKLEEKGNVEFLSTKFMVMIRGERSYAMVVQSLKQGDTPQGPVETSDHRPSPGDEKGTKENLAPPIFSWTPVNSIGN
jgi:hypothetical protein